MTSQPSRRIASLLRPTVWAEFTPMAQRFQAVNLGQGFPDWKPPPFLTESAHTALEGPWQVHQYGPSGGWPKLCEGVAKKYEPILKQASLDPRENVFVSVGSSQVLFTCFQALCNPGDEVVVFEPFFDIYLPQAMMSGAVPRYVPMRFRSPSPTEEEEEKEKERKEEDPARSGNSSKDQSRAPQAPLTSSLWKIDMEALEETLSERTRIVLLNSPNNPTGKVFTHAELEELAEVVKRKAPRAVVLSDEVYEHMIFPSETQEGHLISPLPRIANVAGMWERSLTISSFGKTFSSTGWKMGFAVGHADLVRLLVHAQQYMPFCVPTILQESVASALETASQPYGGKPTYWEWLEGEYRNKRAHLMETLTHAGFNPIGPEGSFFILVDLEHTHLLKHALPSEPAEPGTVQRPDYEVCRFLTKEVGVCAIPCSAFYDHDGDSASSSSLSSSSSLEKGRLKEKEKFIRFAFCKTEAALDEARRRLYNHFREMS